MPEATPVHLIYLSQKITEAATLCHYEPSTSYYAEMLREALANFDEARAALVGIEGRAPLVVTADAPDEGVGF